MKKLLVAILAAAFLAGLLVPATAATRIIKPVNAQASRSVKVKKDHKKIGNPAKKLAKGVKKDVHKMGKAVKKAFTHKHKTAKRI